MKLIINSVAFVIIIVSMLYYYRQVSHYRKTEKNAHIFANASQLTMSAYLLGLGVILIELNAFGLSRGKFVNHLIVYGAFVSLVNALSIWYFSRLAKSESINNKK